MTGILGGNFSVSGVATLTAYGGFVAQQQHVNKPAAIGFATVGLQTAGVSHQYQYYETTTEFTDLGGVHHGDDQYFNTLSEDLVIDDGQILNITNTEMVGVTTIGEYDPHTHHHMFVQDHWNKYQSLDTSLFQMVELMIDKRHQSKEL